MGVGDFNFLSILACFVTELLQCKLNNFFFQKVIGIMFGVSTCNCHMYIRTYMSESC